MPNEITVGELAKRLKAGEPTFLLDVREDWEREIAKLPGDVHVPMNEIPARLGEIAAPAGGVVVCYCHGGVRSFNVAAYLEKNGIPALSLAGGIDAWSDAIDPNVPRY